MRFCPGWDYRHFDDQRILAFFAANPLEEFPDIIDKFHSFSCGAHKADLFRYYFLYLEGGVYLDSDAVLEAPIDAIINNYQFVTINGYHQRKNLIFNGFLICPAKHPIMKAALDNAYSLDNQQLIEDYHLICKNLFDIIQKDFSQDSSVNVYQEEKNDDYLAATRTFNTNRQLLLTHYCYLRRVPGHAMTAIRHLYPWLFSSKFRFKTYRALQKIFR